MPKGYACLLRENARLREACENARSAGVVYTHIAHALARGYTDEDFPNGGRPIRGRRV